MTGWIGAPRSQQFKKDLGTKRGSRLLTVGMSG
jgi:hypothetical protein